MAEKWSLLEFMSAQMGCEYLSDLRFLSGERRRELARRLEPLSPGAGDMRDWNEALEYLTGAPPEKTAAQAQKTLIRLLAQSDIEKI